MSRTLVITGAAGGVGGALTRRAIDRGDRVFATARTLEELAEFGADVTPISINIADDKSVAAGFEAIGAALAGGKLDAVIHCAGVAPHAAVELTTPAAFAEILNINAVGSFRVLLASMPLLRQSGGRCILIASLWARTGGPLLAGYAASKHAISALADSARREAPGFDISVIELGVVRTSMLLSQRERASGDDQLGRYAAQYAAYRALTVKSEPSALDPEKAARGIERALTDARPKPRYRVGNDSKAVSFITWLLPASIVDALFAKLVPSGKPGVNLVSSAVPQGDRS